MILYVILFIAIIGIPLTIRLVANNSKRKRYKTLEGIAKSNNLDLFSRGDTALRKKLSRFHVFHDGQSHMARNVMQGNVNGMDVSIMDFDYRLGSLPVGFTLLFAESDNLNLPDFILQPEKRIDSVAAKLGSNDIDFDDYRYFSREYLLDGIVEKKVREIFNSDLIKFFESNLNYCLQGRGKEFILYHKKSYRSPYGHGSLLNKAKSIYGILLKNKGGDTANSN